MSEGDVSLIRDEDVLRRMWQQTEDFSRKKEIRAHMYRLREERLRNLYSPEPTEGKGCEFTSTQGHVKSFADQSFQSMKSKEVRDAGSPPKEFAYRGQDLKDLSNAGWNVETENRTTDDGHTQVKSVHANIQGRYDVDGGKGQFTAADHHKQAFTEYNDGNSSLKRNEDFSNTSAHEQVVRQTDDGSHFSSTTSSSTSTSKFEQVSSKHETVPYLTNDDYDLASQKSYDTNKKEITSNRITKTNNYEQSLRNDYDQGELVSRKIDYPDDNTKVIVETRCLPDGTRVTSTRREFRAPSVQTSRSEHHSQQIRNESKSSSSYSSTQKRSQTNESSKIIRESIDDSAHNIVDSQRIKDDFDFRKEYSNVYDDNVQRQVVTKTNNNERDHREYTSSYDNHSTRQQDDTKTNYYTDTNEHNVKITRGLNEDELNRNDRNRIENTSQDNKSTRSQNITETRYANENQERIHHITRDENVPEHRRPKQSSPSDKIYRDDVPSNDDQNNRNHEKIREDRYSKDTVEHVQSTKRDTDVKEVTEKRISDQYQTTYQSDYAQRKISNEWSPTHQAWASTLRSDTPSRPTTRASSPGSKTFKSSDSSLRSSVSPDKNYRKTPSRGGSPNKIDRSSPMRTTSDRYSSTQSSTYSIHETRTNKYSSFDNTSPNSKSPTRQSPDRKSKDGSRQRPSVSPEKQVKTPTMRPSTSPQRKSSPPTDTTTPYKKSPIRSSPSPDRKYTPKESRTSTYDDVTSETNDYTSTLTRNKETTSKTTTVTNLDEDFNTTSSVLNKQETKSSESPDRQPGYMRHTASSLPKVDDSTPSKPQDSRKSPSNRFDSQSPERKYIDTKIHNVKEQHDTFINKARQTYSNYDKDVTSTVVRESSPSQRKSPLKDSVPESQPNNDISTRKPTPSPDRKAPSERRSPSKDVIEMTPKMKNDSPVNETKHPNRLSPEKAPITPCSPRQPSRETSPVKRTMSPEKHTTKPHEREYSPTPAKSPSPSRKSLIDSNTYKKDTSPTRKSPTKDITNIKRSDVTDSTITKTSVIENITDKTSYEQDIKEKYTTSEDTNIKTNTDTITKIHKTKTVNDKPTTSVEPLSRSSPRRSTSPTKSLTKVDTKYKQTTEFITMERATEETDKRKANEHPRKLVTPSTSPTRKPKTDETAPSSGQSTPTTTASGFVYFGSPQVDKPIDTTDLNDKVTPSTDKPVNSDVLEKTPSRRTPSPTKIPSRSSPEKVVIKENLPRKSSLKKPSVDNSHTSPVEKPPTSFLISQNDVVKTVETKVTIDEPQKKDAPIKTKPPLERRETYEERCRKILGMTDDTTTEAEKTSLRSKQSISPETSPSISPCESPVQFEEKPFIKDAYETVDVVDISEETSVISEQKPNPETAGKYSRDNVNLQDINVHNTETHEKVTLSDIKVEDKTVHEQKSLLKTKSNDQTEKTSTRSPSESPQRKSSYISPDRTSRKSPEKVQKSPTLDTPNDKLNKTDLNKKNTIDIYEEDIIKNAVDNQKDTNRTTQVTTKEHTIKEESTNFILSEREQQILDRVQSSLRKLSPDRNKKIPNQDKPESQCIITDTVDAATLSKNIQKETLEKTDDTVSVTVLEEKTTTTKNNLANNRPVSKSQIPSKPSSRNVSPNKKSPTSPNLSKATPVRSTSPKKPASPTEKKPGSPIDRPQSPQVPRTVTKTKEPVTTQKPSSVNDVKKVPTVKQHSTSRLTQSKISTVKTTTTTKSSEPEPKRINQLKGKTPDAKVTRTVSDIAMKSPLQKKVSPQRIKSKPEIQVTNVTSPKATKQSNIRQQRPSGKESPTKLPVSKPKSAIDINTSMDEDDIIIDVQQAKSSRENSPDRICPTPVGFLEDTGTPRFPDEVNEPDDEFTKRTHNVIHETESIVDDIVEICEDDELFVRRNEYDVVDKKYESLLKVDDRVSKFNKRTDTNKAEETSRFKNTEVRKHSDFIDENLKSDECLLSVSEKVNKFAKGPLRPKDKSPSRNIAEEFDKDTIYQDDYTKLSVNDKAHLFIETAENTKVTKQKPVQKPERPDLTNVDDSLKSDECLLSVSDKVNKFVKTAEQVLSDAYVVEEKERKIKEQHDKIMQQIVENVDDTITKTDIKKVVTTQVHDDNLKETSSPNERDDQTTIKIDGQMPKTKTTPKIAEKTPAKITTLRSSEAVKKAKALFENIATTTNKTKDTTKTAKLTDIGVVKKVKPSTDAVQSIKRDTDTKNEKQKSEHINIEYETTEIQEISRPRQKSPEIKSNVRDTSPVCRTRSPIAREKSPRPMSPIVREKSPINRTLSPMARDASPASGRKSPFTRPKTPRAESPVRRTQSPIQHVTTTTTVTKKVLSRFPAAEPASHKQVHPEDRPEKTEKVPGYQRPTKTSQMKEEKTVEEIETSSRRGSGKFGVELRRTSADRSSVSSERRRSSEHHQPCIEDIFDLDLLEQMLEKVVGYEQRRRIRAQIRVAKKRVETEKNTTITRTTKQTTKSTKTKSPERQPLPRSPDRQAKFNKPHSPERLPKTPHKTSSPDRLKITPTQNIVEPSEQPKQPLMNGHPKEPSKIIKDKETRPHSPDKHQKSTLSTPSPKTPRPSSPDKKTRPVSPSKAATPKSKSNRFSEYASAYMKKVGLNDSDKQKVVEAKTKKAPIIEEAKTRRIETSRVEHHSTKTYSERTSSKDIIEVIQVNGKKSPSPERCVREKSYDRVTEISHPRKESPERRPADKITLERKASPQRKSPSPERRSPDVSERITGQRSPSPDVKPKTKKETIIKTVVDVGKKVPQKQVQEEKPSWVTNRNLKKVTSETRTFSSKKIETEKPKYRASSPSKAITKPIDVITSSYGPGPLDADGRPLFGIKALRNGATNYQVKGTVIRQEFHSRNGGEPQGTVSVTAYSTQPEDLEKLLQTQGEKPSRLHGLAAITTTKKFGGDTGTTYSEVTTKEERAALDQFTHTDRKIQESKIERHSDTFDTKQSKQTIERITEGESDKKTEEVKRRTEKKESGRKEIDKLEKRTDKMQKTERRVDDRKTVRQSSVKSLTEKFIKNASETTKSERSAYPKAGLILRTTSVKDNVSESSGHAGLARTDSEQSLGSVEDVVTTREQIGDVIRTTTTTTRSGKTERSFLDSSTKVTGVQDILTRMKNADIVIEEGDSNEDSEARALLNKFLGATVLMAGMQSYVTERPGGVVVRQETVQSSNNKVRQLEEVDIEQCWDERVLRKLLDECTDYEARRRLRARIRTLMAEQEACASAVTEALAAAGETIETVETEEQQQSGEREEEEITTVTSSVRRNSSEKTVSTTTIKNTKVVESMRPAPKPVSPFAKFRQLEKQNSTNTPKM